MRPGKVGLFCILTFPDAGCKILTRRGEELCKHKEEVVVGQFLVSPSRSKKGTVGALGHTPPKF